MTCEGLHSGYAAGKTSMSFLGVHFCTAFFQSECCQTSYFICMFLSWHGNMKIVAQQKDILVLGNKYKFKHINYRVLG